MSNVGNDNKAAVDTCLVIYQEEEDDILIESIHRTALVGKLLNLVDLV